MFINRAELLPEDETVAEHQQAKEDEAGVLAADRTGPGLFKGVFSRQREPMFNALAAALGNRGIVDRSDGVIRCPDCHWELEDGECLQCGFNEYEPGESDYFSEMDSDGSESGHTINTEYDQDGEEVDGEFHATMHPPAFDPYSEGYESATHGTDATGTDHGDYYDEDDEMDGFIERDDANQDDDDDRSEATMTSYHREARSVARDDSPDLQELYNQPGNHAATAYAPGSFSPSHALATNYDESTQASESENNFPTIRRNQVRGRRTVISDDEDDDEDENDEQATVEEGNTINSEVDSEADSEADSEEDESEESASSNESSEDDGSVSEDSDEIRPPQPSAVRRQHLQSQRARRPINPYQPHEGVQQADSRSNSHIRQRSNNHHQYNNAGNHSRPGYNQRLPVSRRVRVDLS